MRFLFLCTSLFLCMTLCSQDRTIGLFSNLPEAYNGYTLFSNNTSTYLIDNCGFIVNEWQSDFETFGTVYLREDGSLFRLVKLDNGSFLSGGSGGRFELFSWEGELLWYYEFLGNQEYSHHDIEFLPNGNFLALVWEVVSAGEALDLGRESNRLVWTEKVVEIEMLEDNEINIPWEWRVRDHLIQDQFPDRLNYGNPEEHPGRIDFNFTGNVTAMNRDWLHFNSVDYNSTLDQIVVSTKHLNEVWIIDHSTTTSEAASSEGGRWGRGGELLYRYGNPPAYSREGAQVFGGQHSVSWIGDDQLMVFNNNFGANRSAVQVWSLPVDSSGAYNLSSDGVYGPSNIDWTYTDVGFFSNILSSARMLPNENVLICEGLEGRFFEVDQDGMKVWEYINPVNRNGGAGIQGGEARLNSVFQVLRYSPDFIGFDGRDLSPTRPVELSPIESDCIIHLPVSTHNQSRESQVKIYPNPSDDYISIKTPSDVPFDLKIYDSAGQLLLSLTLTNGVDLIDISRYKAGLYYAKVTTNYFTHLSDFIKI